MTVEEIRERQEIIKDHAARGVVNATEAAVCLWLSELCLQVAEFNDTLRSTVNSSNCPLYVQVEPGQHPIMVDVKK